MYIIKVVLKLRNDNTTKMFKYNDIVILLQIYPHTENM